MTTKIDKCPFCRCINCAINKVKNFELYQVSCPSCLMSGPVADIESLAIDRWNSLSLDNAIINAFREN